MAGKTRSKAQREQAKLLEDALKRPGVAAAVEAYERVEAYAPQPVQAVAKGSYATGGNVA
jgi:hypothetical protein